MNIWIVNHYASPPDQPSTSSFDVAKGLAGRGHRVTVFASSFNHYRLKELRLRPKEWWKRQEYEGVRFIWIKTPPYRRNNWRRARNMLAFAWRAFRIGRRTEERPDVILGATVHPFAALAAWCLSVSKKVPFIYEVRDLWPLTLVEFGRISRSNPLALALGALDGFLSRQAARVVTTLPGAADYYAERGVDRHKVVWIANGLEADRIGGLGSYNGKLSSPFTVMYVGGHFYALALDVIVRSAALLQQSGRDNVRFVMVGGGQEKPALIKLSAELQLRNIEWREVVPKSELPRVLEEADAFILGLRHRPKLYCYGISLNKLNDYMAAGRPIIFAGSPHFNPVVEAQAGICVPPENPRALAEAIDRLVTMTPEARAQMGRNGQSYVRAHHDIALLTEKTESLLASVLREASSRLAGARSYGLVRSRKMDR